MIAKTFKKLSLIAILSVASVILFAASGGKGKKGSKTTVNVTVRQSTQNFSLRSGYKFKGGKLLQFDNSSKRNYMSLNSYSAVKQGNTTRFVATKHILNTTSQISPATKNTGYEVKLLKIKLN